MMLKLGRSSSAGIGPGPLTVPLSTMVPIPWASLMVALVAFVKFTKNCSLPSNVPSLVMVTGTVMVTTPTPAAKFRVPLVAVKSLPLVAVSPAVA